MIFCFILISFNLFLIGCSHQNNQITIVYDAMPASFDPHLRRQIVTISILSNIYEALVTVDPNMKIIPGIAEYWEKLDSLTWRFYLRDNVRFHNDKKLSSSDVIYSIYRPFNLPGSQYTALKGYVDTIIPEDTNKILVRLKMPNPFLLYDLANIFIIPEKFNPSDRIFCGTGPYRVKNLGKDKIELVRFSNYWNNRIDFERATIIFVPEVTKRIELLREKKADIITFIPLTYLEQISNAGRIIATSGVAVRYIEMDLSKFPFNQPEFRQALNLGINRQFLAENVYQNFAVPANQFISQGLFGFDYNLPQFIYNPDSARKLLKKIGELPVIDFDFAESRAFIARAIIEDMEKIGIKITAHPLSVDKYWEKINSKRSDFYLIGSVPLSNEGVSILRSSFHTKDTKKGLGNLNNSNYSNKELDLIIEKMIRIYDLRTCAKLISDAQKILLKDLPKIPVVWEKEIYGISDRIDWNPRLDELIIIKEIKLRK
ncbi:MAG: ABC transporter substrate-binding protein [candidate division WOR-3 bacterium]